MLMSKAELVLVYRVMSFFYLYVLKQVKNMAQQLFHAKIHSTKEKQNFKTEKPAQPPTSSHFSVLF